jgi:hydroxymethylglutaryl-CoA lyase
MTMRAVELLETSPRDGLQNEPVHLSTEDKVALVARAVAAGARRVEVTSFVHSARVPQLADAEAVVALLPRGNGVRYSALIANGRGLDRAIAARVDDVNIVVVASETFCHRNQGMSTAEATETARRLVEQAHSAGLSACVTVAAAFGCPFEGEVPIDRVRDVVTAVVASGPDELALADTIGVAVPQDITARVAAVRAIAGPALRLRLHLHDTRHTGVANAVAGLAAGVQVFDTSIGGAGGCPFAPGATGNVATEDLVYLFDRMGVHSGLDLARLTDSVKWLEQRLVRSLPGALGRAGGFPA